MNIETSCKISQLQSEVRLSLNVFDIMSHMTYYRNSVSPKDKPLVGMFGEVKTPPFSAAARLEAGFLLRRLQKGEILGMPYSRTMPSIGPRCHELRINDETETWRIVYRIDSDAVIIVEVFSKKTA